MKKDDTYFNSSDTENRNTSAGKEQFSQIKNVFGSSSHQICRQGNKHIFDA